LDKEPSALYFVHGIWYNPSTCRISTIGFLA